jgi:hypothetical protein
MLIKTDSSKKAGNRNIQILYPWLSMKYATFSFIKIATTNQIPLQIECLGIC